jgi:hypothetical protein
MHLSYLISVRENNTGKPLITAPGVFGGSPAVADCSPPGRVVSYLRLCRKLDEGGAAQYRMALRASVRTIAIERHTSALSPREARAGREPERGAPQKTSASSPLPSPPSRHGRTEERAYRPASSAPVTSMPHIPVAVKLRESSGRAGGFPMV